MKYSLRSLMIVVTLACVVLGGAMGRVEYLRRWARYHEREAEKCAKAVELEQHVPRELVDSLEHWWVEEGVDSVERAEKNGPPTSVFVTPDFKKMHRHRRLARRYHQALHRPWRTVDETIAVPGD